MSLKRNIPNFISILNLVVGFIALWLVAQQAFLEAFYLLCACLILDFFDGFLARLLNAKSSFGAQFDSFADLVSFGVLPGFFVLNYLQALNAPFILLVLSAIYPATAAIRLVRFNLDDSASSDYFTGMPTPISAILLMSLIHLDLKTLIDNPELHRTVIAVFVVLVSLMMISKVKILSLKFQGFEWGTNKWRYVLIVMGVITLIFAPSFAVVLIYIELLILSLLSFKI